MNRTLICLFVGIFVGASALACGFTDDDSNSSSSSQDYSCCLNGQYFDCSDAGEFETCNFDDFASDCSRDPSRDDECQ